MARILNLGSLNLDRVFRVPHIVTPGQTLGSAGYQTYCGGKGLNQSVALARAGAEVWHVGRIGSDGVVLSDALRESGVVIEHVAVDEALASGQAIIQVGDDGENAIVLDAGANRAISSDQLDAALDGVSAGDWFLTQNETNLVAEALSRAKARGLKTCLNPAPIDASITAIDLTLVDLLVVNQTEAAALGEALSRHDRPVVHTLGKAGATWTVNPSAGTGPDVCVQAEAVTAVDTTAAGDCFIGYLLAGLVAGLDPEAALGRANRAAAISVTRPGAMASIPHASEL